MLIRTNDTVEVISGDSVGARGKVLRVDRRAGKIVVEGVNRAYKHVRRGQRNPQGGRLSVEMPIPASNALVVCEKCGRPARMGRRYAADGAKERYCKKCGSANGQIAPAKPGRANK